MTDHREHSLAEGPDVGTDTAAFLESVLTAVPAFIIRADHNLNIRYVNRFQPGLTPELVIGRSIYEFVPLDDREVMRASIERARASGRLQSFGSRGTGPHGAISHYETFVAPVRETDGTVGVCLAAVEITRQRELEEQLRQSQKLEAIGSLTAGIAHNFNNMLTVILPTLDLTAKLLPPERAPLLREATHAARRAAEMVQQLMTYAGQSHASERQPHAIHTVVDAAVAICRRTFDPRIELLVAYDGLPMNVLCNPAQLEQVFVNLLMNARDAVQEAGRGNGATETRGSLRVHVRSVPAEPTLDARDSVRAARVLVEVIDNGAGMTEAVRARAFEPFFTTKAAGRGTGLGLATSYAIVRDHDGELACRSTPSIGTTMAISLPITKQPTTEAREPVLLSVPAGRCVLLVDDELAGRTTLQYVLADAGIAVLLAESGVKALDMLSKHRDTIDVVLLDRSMPGGSGESFVPRLRAISSRARIVFLSGQTVEPTLAALVDAVVPKPVTGAALLDAIQRVLV